MQKLLGQIESPADMKHLNIEELTTLAAEIRAFLLENISQTGGHLSSNLGTVELILALHYVYDSPKDQFLFDVGHQAYTHKILTGRKEAFKSLRSYEGLSGFLKRHESPHDIYGAGHASTAISAAFGFARAKSLQGDRSKTIAVVGDGALTGGLAYEGLSVLGDHPENVLIIINDNTMSISPNVGAVNRTLNRLRTSHGYTELKGKLDRVLPAGAARTLRSMKSRLRHFLLPVTFFESMGSSYYGPIDGHDLARLIDTLQKLKAKRGPLVLHVRTEKGKGYDKALLSPDAYHGVGSFCLEEGLCPPIEEDFSAAMGSKLLEMAKEDQRIIALTAAMSQGTGLSEFEKQLPKQFLDVGIAEPNMLTIAAAMSLQGMKPFVAIYSTFLQRAYDVLLHDIAIQQCPIVLCIDRSGLVGADGETHQGIYDVAYLSSIPGLSVLAPKDRLELERMMEWAREASGPVAIRYPRDKAWQISEDATDLTKVEMLREKGNTHLALSYGRTLKLLLDAVEEKKLPVDVANLRFIQPLDFKELEELFAKYEKISFFEEVVYNGSTAQKLKAHFPNVQCKTLPDSFIEQGSIPRLLNEYGLDAEGIAHALRENSR